MLKKAIIKTFSIIRDFEKLSFFINPFNSTYFFELENNDNSNYKLSIDKEDFIVVNSGEKLNLNLTTLNSSLNFKLQLKKVSSIRTDVPLSGSFREFFLDLINLKTLICINVDFLGSVSDISDSISHLELTGKSNNPFDLNQLPISLNKLKISGDFKISSYTRRNWVNGISFFVLENEKGQGLSEQNVDNLLEDLSETTLSSSCFIKIKGNNSAPSSVGQSFINSLISQGAVVQTN
jgi:hypothetical protein